jgi:lysophospholipase L1-like esterase
MPLKGKENKTNPIEPKKGTIIEEAVLSKKRLDSFVGIAESLRKQDIQLIVVIPPFNSNILPTSYKKYLTWLESKKEEFDFRIWNYSNDFSLNNEYFWDRGHLNIKGAELFSSELGKRFKSMILFRNNEIDDNIKKPVL